MVQEQPSQGITLSDVISEISKEASDLQQEISTELEEQTDGNTSMGENQGTYNAEYGLDMGSPKEKDKVSGDYVYDVYADHVAVTEYTGTSLKVKIPAEIDGMPVKRIMRYEEDRYNKYAVVPGNVISVELPESIVAIGERAFYETSIKTINLPDSILSIGDGAFSHCSKLENVHLPNQLDYLGGSAFFGCENAFSGKLTIPDSLSEIKEGTFTDTSENTSITELVIPGSVTKIGSDAFRSCVALAKVTLGNGVEEIGKHTFGECTSLKEINFPSSLKTIEEQAFYGCALETVDLPEGVSLETEVFARNNNLKKAVIPKGTTFFTNTWLDKERSGEGLFSQCSNLEEVEIYSEMVPAAAFSDCDALKTIKLSEDVLKIGNSSFSTHNPKNQIAIHIPASVEVINEYFVGGNEKYYTIYGKAGSEAEKIAKSRGIKFVEE